jgi:hypothetical protein
VDYGAIHPGRRGIRPWVVRSEPTGVTSIGRPRVEVAAGPLSQFLGIWPSRMLSHPATITRHGYSPRYGARLRLSIWERLDRSLKWPVLPFRLGICLRALKNHHCRERS